jgi:hypothetical protein
MWVSQLGETPEDPLISQIQFNPGLFVSASDLTGVPVQKLKNPTLTAQQRFKMEETVINRMFYEDNSSQGLFSVEKGAVLPLSWRFWHGPRS